MGQVGDAVQLNIHVCVTNIQLAKSLYLQVSIIHSINSTMFYLYNRSMTMCLILSR